VGEPIQNTDSYAITRSKPDRGADDQRAGSTHKQADMTMFACIRNAKGAVVDLKPAPMPGEVEAKSPLLEAFLTGFRLFRR
jgi:hypothetical protein